MPAHDRRGACWCPKDSCPQSFYLLRPSPVCRKRLALPFDGRAIPALKPSPRNRNRHLAKRAHHLAFASPVAMARDARRGHRSFIAKPLRDIHSHGRLGLPPRVTRAAECIAQFFLEDLLDKAANATALQRLDAVAPAFTSQHICCIRRHWRCLHRWLLTAGLA